VRRGFFSRVVSSRTRAGVRAGLIAAAATGGAIIGFGIRHTDWAGPFATLGLELLHGFGVAGAPRSVTIIAGLVAHVAWMVVWGIAFATASHRKTPAMAVVFALLVGLSAAVFARFLIPSALGAVSFASMPSIQAALCVGLMTAGFVAGRALSHVE
jgi:hypothetical protein